MSLSIYVGAQAGGGEQDLALGELREWGEAIPPSIPQTHALNNTGDDEILIVTTELLNDRQLRHVRRDGDA